jgi:hypothetical protein
MEKDFIKLTPEEERNLRRSEKLRGIRKPLDVRARMHASHLHTPGTPEWEEAVRRYLDRVHARARVVEALSSPNLEIV